MKSSNIPLGRLDEYDISRGLELTSEPYSRPVSVNVGTAVPAEVLKQSQLEIGAKIEMEHEALYDHIVDVFFVTAKTAFPMTKDEFVRWIAEDHINEIPDYYDRLVKMEQEAKGEHNVEI